MSKAEKVSEAGLVEVWALFWPKKNWDANQEAVVVWLEAERLKSFMEGVEAGLAAAYNRQVRGEWVISKDDILNREEQ